MDSDGTLNVGDLLTTTGRDIYQLIRIETKKIFILKDLLRQRELTIPDDSLTGKTLVPISQIKTKGRNAIEAKPCGVSASDAAQKKVVDEAKRSLALRDKEIKKVLRGLRVTGYQKSESVKSVSPRRPHEIQGISGTESSKLQSNFRGDSAKDSVADKNPFPPMIPSNGIKSGGTSHRNGVPPGVYYKKNQPKKPWYAVIARTGIPRWQSPQFHTAEEAKVALDKKLKELGLKPMRNPVKSRLSGRREATVSETPANNKTDKKPNLGRRPRNVPITKREYDETTEMDRRDRLSQKNFPEKLTKTSPAAENPFEVKKEAMYECRKCGATYAADSPEGLSKYCTRPGCGGVVGILLQAKRA